MWGYRPLRSLVAYLALVGGFAAALYILGDLRWYEALVVSLTAFHRHDFLSQQYVPGDPQSILAAVEAVFGLLIEIRFIATFTSLFSAGEQRRRRAGDQVAQLTPHPTPTPADEGERERVTQPAEVVSIPGDRTLATYDERPVQNAGFMVSRILADDDAMH